jgi:hypothetical protein
MAPGAMFLLLHIRFWFEQVIKSTTTKIQVCTKRNPKSSINLLIICIVIWYVSWLLFGLFMMIDFAHAFLLFLNIAVLEIYTVIPDDMTSVITVQNKKYKVFIFQPFVNHVHSHYVHRRSRKFHHLANFHET